MDFFIDAVVRRAIKKDVQRVYSIRSQMSQFPCFSRVGRQRAIYRFIFDEYNLHKVYSLYNDSMLERGKYYR